MTVRVVFLNLFAGSLQERAKHAEELLGEFILDEAFDDYTSILNELQIDDKPSLEFVYWIYRERSFTAFLKDDLAIMQSDVQRMKDILVQLGFSSEYGTKEYWYAIDLAKRGKVLIEKTF